ncbi:MAG: CRTAC1 family protein [Acidobacteriota bacterium]
MAVALFPGLAVLSGVGCQPGAPPSGPAKGTLPVRDPVVPAFREIAAAAGIRYRHETGAFGRKLLPETMGSGCAFLDYDGDGLEDVLLLSGSSFPGQAPREAIPVQLYRNRGEARFEDASAASGIAAGSAGAYAMGVAAADVDNDGDADVLVTCLGADLFFENLGNGTFRERASELGLADDGFGSSAAWLDANGDGLLDLFVGNYVTWTVDTDIYCSMDGKTKSYCTPESYAPARCRFHLGRPGLSFQDATESSGVGKPPAKALGVATLDADGDGLLDLAVANDTLPNFLFRSKGDGTFDEIGATAGIALSESGAARGAMGIDAADYDGSGRSSLVIGNFSRQMLSLYRNEGNGTFVDVAARGEVGRTSLLILTFPCFFADVNLDGWPDIFAGNGHVEPQIASVQKEIGYAEPPLLYVNGGGGTLREAASSAGPDLARPIVARGGAWGDPDGDGDPDILITCSGGPALLFQNGLDRPERAVTLLLQGTKSNRDAIGARVSWTVGGTRHALSVSGGGSYLSQSSRRLLLGVGPAGSADQVSVRWPSGLTEDLGSLRGGQHVRAIEGSGARSLP